MDDGLKPLEVSQGVKNPCFVFALSSGVLFIIGLAGLFPSCDFGDDEDKDVDEVACDKGCLDEGLSDSADCLYEHIDCLEAGSDEEFCLLNSANCLNGALDRECFCANSCNGCIEPFCDCAQACSTYDIACVKGCFPVLFDCADWIDNACYESCSSQFDSCFYSCQSDQSYHDCYECVDIYESCYESCY